MIYLFCGTSKTFEHCNNDHPTIKFTKSVSDSAVNFLDAVVKISESKISMDLYTKPISIFTYSPAAAIHVIALAYPYKSQALRLRCICSDQRG